MRRTYFSRCTCVDEPPDPGLCAAGSVLAAMQLEWPRCDSREWCIGRREREREERLCVRACMRAGHGTRCNDDGGGDFNDDGGGGTRIEDEGGRKKDRLG